MMSGIERILYATDLAHNSVHVFGYASYLAKLTGAELHLLHVVSELSEDVRFTLQAYVIDPNSRHRILEERVEKARALFLERQDRYWSEQTEEDRKVRAQIKSMTVCEAFAPEAILKTAKEHKCDLVVIGAHARGFTHTFLGGVAEKVLRRSRIPSLVVPLPEED